MLHSHNSHIVPHASTIVVVVVVGGGGCVGARADLDPPGPGHLAGAGSTPPGSIRVSCC